ncbi:hypothetical protein VOLCADRAFT_104005 [Volvox carteri f. nagariensis]|uniref:Uncharacterized protein n=1 Tax=Volvox carteri f. nagariensis TaxID=3068 RepID=D8TQK8_VOLCA|nr:uncharacterized protein VOLCADRAFT_104005 [Volvox carteri f. nagariensis]EFJ50169.1 hypothetical protein VOLCADRAFT_104005 [Volvox carteri f. nagariensis]|eukprot:XP_002948789.1 hypothetical protein VOLCADRAFT_104005 [Volvox carteri f. nagariensis]
MAPKPKQLTAPLRPILVAGLAILLPICFSAFVIGIFGMRILLDEDGSSSLSRSVFGQYYKRLIAINPFFSALIFNGGMIGSMFCVTKLVEHGYAAKSQPSMTTLLQRIKQEGQAGAAAAPAAAAAAAAAAAGGAGGVDFGGSHAVPRGPTD